MARRRRASVKIPVVGASVAVEFSAVGAEGEQAPAVDDESDGRGGSPQGIADGFLDGFDERGQGHVAVVEEAGHGFDGNHGAGGAREGRESRECGIDAVDVLRQEAPEARAVVLM